MNSRRATGLTPLESRQLSTVRQSVTSVMNKCMALFTRRVIQRYLDESTDFVSADDLWDWVQRLNKVSSDYVATEWEVILVRAFAKFGKVLHEPLLGRRPIDLVFESFDGKLRFAADITAISDQPIHDKNPIDRFQDELRRRQYIKVATKCG